jgi:hypothetical protein
VCHFHILLIRALGFFSAFAFIGQVAQRDFISFPSAFSIKFETIWTIPASGLVVLYPGPALD